MTLTKAERDEMFAIGESLDASGTAMEPEMVWEASDRYNELQAKMALPEEPDIPFLSIRQPGDIRTV